MKKGRKIMSLLTAAAMSCSVMLSASVGIEAEETGYSHEMRGLTALQIVSDMGAGWNLGNSFEATNDETYWGNPRTTDAMIDAVAAKGFTTLRIPVRWDDHYSNAGSYTIDTAFLDRVSEVVDSALDNDMYVILNSHHCDYQTMVSSSPSSTVNAELKAQWTQIANYFKNYGDKLIFETNNEPRSGEDWTGNSSYYNTVNAYNETARAAIRATGGNNSTRLITMPTYCASGDEAKVAGWKKLADDNMVAVSIHAYLPYDFAFNRSGHSDWTASDEAELKAYFNRLKTYFLDKGIPVIVDEFGSVDKNNTAARVKCAELYTALARSFAQQDIPCVWWDNNCVNTDGENFGIYNRNSNNWYYSSIANALVNAYKGDPVPEASCSSENVLFEGNGTSSNYGQAVNMPPNAVTDLSAGNSICVNFSGSNPELILQSYTGGNIWCKVNPDSISGGTAVWSYETLKNAYSAYETPFLRLDKVCVGDTGSITVTKVYSTSSTKGHTHSYNGAEKVTVQATATTKGRKSVSCSVDGCSAYKVVSFEYTGDNNDNDNDNNNIASEEDVKQFVDRLYTIILDRNAEEAGLADWTNRLLSGKATSAEIVYGIANSPEFNGKGLSNDEIVERMYLAMLGRPSDAGGKADWVDCLNNGMTVTGIINGFSGSQEFAKICAEYNIQAGNITTCEPRDRNSGLTRFVARMYTKALDRASETAGLNDWTGRYLNKEIDAAGIAKGFLNSQEFLNKGFSNEDYVNRLYRIFFNREPSAEEKQGWIAQLNGGASRDSIVDGFAGSPEFNQLKAGFGV